MKVILKVDDFWGKLGDGMWENFLDYLNNKNIKISLGIVGEGLEKASFDVVDYVRALINIEPYNHSYYHIIRPHVLSEFYQTSRPFQIKSIDKTNKVINERLGRETKVMGFVANSFDLVTVSIMSENFDDMTHIYAVKGNDLLGNLSIVANVLVINEDCAIERNNAINQNFEEEFAKIKDDELAIFQLHPGMWDSSMLDRFKEIVEFLVANNCEFIFPTELCIKK